MLGHDFRLTLRATSVSGHLIDGRLFSCASTRVALDQNHGATHGLAEFAGESDADDGRKDLLDHLEQRADGTVELTLAQDAQRQLTA